MDGLTGVKGAVLDLVGLRGTSVFEWGDGIFERVIGFLFGEGSGVAFFFNAFVAFACHRR